MTDVSKKNQFIDLFGLLCIGTISLGYVIFNRPFAELSIQLPILDFPIFIGEILLFVCLCLYLWKNDLRIKKWHFWVIGYFAFVIFKALTGYLQFGPLALRNAALFYYTIFIIFAYSFAQRNFLTKKKNIIYIALLLLLISSKGFREPWIFTCFTVIFILSYAYPVKAIKYISLATLLIVAPYKLFFATSRMMMVANFVAGIYVAIGIYFILNARKSVKAAVAVLGILLVGGMLIRFSDRNALTTIIRGDIIIGLFKDSDMEFRAKLDQISQTNRAGRSGEKTQVRIYNPNPKMNFNLFKNDKPVSMAGAGTMAGNTEIQDESSVTTDLSQVQIDDSGPQHSRGTMEKDKPVGLSAAVESGGEIHNMATKTPITQTDTVAPGLSQQQLNNDLASGAEPLADFDPLMNDKSSATENDGPVVHARKAQESSSVLFYNPDPPLSLKSLGLSNRGQEDIMESSGGGTAKSASAADETPLRDLSTAFGNARFRLFIWRDMFRDLAAERPIFGFSFGKPFRSITLETLMWGAGDWQRDGWIAAHNSFIHMIYRAGIVALFIIGTMFVVLYRMIRKSIRCRSLTGYLLCGILINWFVAANFLVTLELPYTAIPIWTLFGLTYAYVEHLKSSALSSGTGNEVS